MEQQRPGRSMHAPGGLPLAGPEVVIVGAPSASRGYIVRLPQRRQLLLACLQPSVSSSQDGE